LVVSVFKNAEIWFWVCLKMPKFGCECVQERRNLVWVCSRVPRFGCECVQERRNLVVSVFKSAEIWLWVCLKMPKFGCECV
jgi:hypothetical protein